LVLPPDLTRTLRELSRSRGTTLFMTLLAAFQALLRRTTGQDDIAAGTPIANRNRGEVEPLIGFFVNTLVLRGDLGGAPSFAGLLRRVRETLLDAYAHQDLPFEKLVEELRPSRSLAYSPLFQVMFALQNLPAGSLELPGLQWSLAEMENRSEKFDLTWNVVETPDGLRGSLSYNVDLFDAATAARMTARWCTLLGGILDAPERRISQLDLLPAAERSQLLAWGRAAEPEAVVAAGDLCLHELFERQAAERPEAVAVVAEGASWTYGRIDLWSRHLAHRLRALGARPEVPVAVALERSIGLIVAGLAVWKAGGVYLPLDPTHPPERLAWMAQDAGAALLVTEEQLLPRLADVQVRRVTLPDLGEPETAAVPPPLSPVASPENLAYLIYTSGSTGTPKAVGVAHGTAARHLRTVAAHFGHGPDSRVLLFAAPGFDVSIEQMLAPLAAGSTLLLRDGTLWDPAAFTAKLADLELTGVDLPPVYWQEWVRGAAASGHNAPPRLRMVAVGGDALPAETSRLWQRSPLAHVRLVNSYGPTEAVITATCQEVTPEVLEGFAGAAVPLGQPLAGHAAYVLDRQGALAPTGTPGEICLSGLLARGYLGRPGLTAERFVPDPFAVEGGEPGGRLYRTGDVARYLPGGRLEYLGRTDHQVKVRGFRIELGEIEAALARLPEVREAAVLALDGADGERRLVACVAAREGAESTLATIAELRSALAATLPDSMLPSGLVTVPALPLSANGKVDRRALAALALHAEVDAGGAQPPRTPLEELLCGIWAEVLGIERVGIDDDFFALGGHSLSATRVVARLQSTLGIELPLRQIFASPTVAALAAVLRREYPAWEPLPALPAGLPGERRGRPLSLEQERPWLLDQIEPGTSHNLPLAVRLTGRLDVAALAGAMAGIVRRHDALRTTFELGEDGPVQVVAPARPTGLPVTDLRGLPAGSREDEADRLAAAEAGRPFNLARGPLLRQTLLLLTPGESLLLATLHRIVADDGSADILVRELAALYDGRELPPLPVQYADFAARQREQPAGQIAWWRARLAGHEGGLDLPVDRPRTAVQSLRSAHLPLALGKPLGEGLRQLAESRGATLFMALLAGFQDLLCRYTGQEDVLVGSPVCQRSPETENLIGLFANTLVLRADLSGRPGFLDLLEQVRDTTLSAHAHQDVSFETLAGEIAASRDRSRPPLVQVMLVLRNAPAGPLTLPGLEIFVRQLPASETKLELALTLMEDGQGLSGAIEYRRDLFDETTVARLAGHFIRLLKEAAADPLRPLSELPLLAADERRQILVEWNETGSLPPLDTALHRLFEAQAARTPGAVALVAQVADISGERWTYGDLDAWADALAHRLAGLGVGPEVRVGVCLRRTPLLVASLLAVLKAGGAYVPLDPAYPRERLAFMAEDSGLAVLVSEPGLADRLPAHRAELLLIDPSAVAAPPPPALPASPVLPGNLAYLIYTSGSTGRPKAVAIEHRSAVAFACWARTAFSPEELAGVLAATSVSFDLSVFELFVTLAWGGKVVLAADALELPRLAAAGEVTLVNTVPSAMAELVRLGVVPASVRTVNLAGEPLKGALVEAIHAGAARLADLRVLNLYGPSESTTYSTWAPAVVRGGGDLREPAIGRPIAGTRAVLLDRRGEPVPVGVAGELLLGGAGLARGYLGRPDLTAERFVPDPFAHEGGEPGGRLYRTGDLARFLPDGRLEYLGRLDHQVKVRGFRIELGEIEAALARLPDVREAAVLVRGDDGDRRLVAVVAPREGAAPTLVTLAALRSALTAALPDYMLPNALVRVPALPLSANGKVDRRALAVLQVTTDADGVTWGRRTARTPLEELLCGIWAEVLGVERVGIDDDFFALGGHSLLATQVVARIQRALGVELPVRRLFEAPTVAALAAALPAASLEPGRSMARRLEDGREQPLSFAQERLWFIDQWEPGSAAYTIPQAVRLTGRLDAAALAGALTEIVRRHEALRTTFEMAAEGPVQVVGPAATVPLPRIDLSGLPAGWSEETARRLAAAEGRRPFHLARGPLLRAVLLRLAPGEHLLFLAVHHIVADGWSIGVLLYELTALYSAFAAGAPSPLPELTLQYGDFAAWQRRRLTGAALEAQLAWWRQSLDGAPGILDLPTDRPRPPVRSSRGAVRRLTVEAPLAAAVRALARREGATLFMALCAALDAFLHRITGQDHVVLGSPIANRTLAETEPLIGLFTNTLALRADLSGDPGFRTLLGRVRETTLGAYAHQDLPFEKLVEELRPERDPRYTPLFQALLVLQNAPQPAVELPGLQMAPVPFESGSAKFDLTLVVAEGAAELRGSLEYCADLFDATTMARWLDQWLRLLAGAAAAPDTPLSELPLLSAAERQALLWEWTDDVHVVDARLQPLPIGVVGEVATGGPGELQGTGDLARRRADGSLEPLGRVEDRARLRRSRRLAAATPRETGAAVPRTPMEEILAGIWGQVLGLAQVGIDDDFFALGGHSLIATRVAARVREAFGVELPVRRIFEAPTVRGFAAALEREELPKALQASALAPLPPAERSGLLPLSFAQERLWFLQQLEPGSATYNMPTAVELTGGLSVAALHGALAAVVRRQESLRTTFVEVDGAPRQRISSLVSASLPRVDLSALPAEAALAEAADLDRQQAGQGFDLAAGPLLRTLLVRLAEDRHRFLFTIHHIVSDGWSIGVLVRELGTLYAAALADRPSPLPELPVQYADLAVWQRRWLESRQTDELAYWEGHLGGQPAAAEMPADRPRPAVQTFRGGRVFRAFDPAFVARLRGFARGEGMTLFMTLLAATQALIARHSGEDDVAVGAPVAGRSRVESEGLIGCFLNTLVLRTDLSGGPGFRELARRVRTVTLEAFSHQDVPFEAVLGRLRLDRDLARTSLFQVLFNVLNLPRAELALPGLDLEVLSPTEAPSKFDMTFYVAENDTQVAINLVYNADLFDAARIVDLLAQLELLLAQAIERPEEPVASLSLLSDTARALLPDPAAPLDAGWIGGVHELFAAQARQAPERPAVIDGDDVWSYGDLLEASLRVAGWLAAAGVQRGDRVAVFAHRSAPLAQAVLGVLHAGAAFVVLDPAYPAPRLIDMLHLAEPRAWVALAAAGAAPDEVRAWLAEAGCPRLELPAGGREAALAALEKYAGIDPQVAVGPG
ncbi:MAG TPA: amino acid adenylation domain-containing protein, partial [Thermoanaerobaculia bacterium]|nr:amino acid adenylation domain-containing protein [Thermoanaerobaculia bacterium]